MFLEMRFFCILEEIKNFTQNDFANLLLVCTATLKRVAEKGFNDLFRRQLSRRFYGSCDRKMGVEN